MRSTYERPTEGDPDGIRLARSITSWISDRPSVITIDDLEPVDKPSVDLLVEAVDRLADLPLLVLVVDPLAPGPGSEVALESLRGWPCLRLEPLDPSAASALARAALGPAAAMRTVDAVVLACHGNPGAIVDTASLLQPGEVTGTASLPVPLPMSASVRARWTERLESLPSSAREGLLALAVVAPTRLDLLVAVFDELGCGVGALDAAFDAGLVHRDAQGVPAVTQPLLRAALVSGAPSYRRRSLHRIAALAAGRLGLPPGVVIEHLLGSADLPDAEVATALSEQAERTRCQGDPHAASRAQAWSARLTPCVDTRRRRILRAVRDRIECVNDRGEVMPLLELVNGSPGADELSAWVTWLRADIEPDLAVAAATEALAIDEARAQAPGLLPRLLSNAADTAWALGDPAAAMEAIEELEQVMRSGVRSEGHEPPWTTVALRAAGLFQIGEVAASVPLRAQALRQADELDPARCDLDTLLSAVELDDLLLADTRGSRARMAAVLRRYVVGTPKAPCLWGMAAWQARARGDWVSAHLLIDDGLALSREVSAVWPLDGLLALSVELAALQGDSERLARHGTALRELGLRAADRRRLAVLDRATGLAALAAGSLDAAAASLAQVADLPFLGRGLRDAVIPARVELVEVLHRLGRQDEARDRAGAVQAVLRSIGQPLADAWDARVSAMVCDPTDADAHFEASLSAHADATDPFEEGRTELLFGEHLRRTRRRSRSRQHLARAEALFQRMQATPWLERAHQELRVAGTSAVPITTSRSVLTAQEANIAEAVAEGRSTREVAELLVLSPRTVETHLSSVYRKLGVRGRAGLARALMEDSG